MYLRFECSRMSCSARMMANNGSIDITQPTAEQLEKKNSKICRASGSLAVDLDFRHEKLKD
jgi:hypothetical protein